MAQNLSAGTGVLANARNTVSSHRASQQAIVNRVESSVQALIGAGGWTGAGASAFQTAANQWIQDAKNINAVLELFENSLQATDTQYQTTEEEAASGAQKLAGASQGYHGMMP